MSFKDLITLGCIFRSLICSTSCRDSSQRPLNAQALEAQL